MKRATLIALILGLFTCAHAQTGGFSVWAGISWLTDSGARAAVGDTGLHVGAGYRLPAFNGIMSPQHGHASVDVDYDRFSANGNDFSAFGISYVERVPIVPVYPGSPIITVPYFGLGIGAWFDHVSGLSDRTTVGGEGILGVNFQRQFFLEGAYHFRADFHGNSPNTVTLCVGMHF